jgi:sarcosine oxidase, subunit gamma
MAVESLVERNALSGRQPIDVPGQLRVAVAPDRARFDLRIGGAGRGAAATAFGCPLSPRIGGVEQRDARSALCVGPDEWLLFAPLDEADKIEEQFRSVQAPHSLVDVGNREVGIDVSGPAATLALNSGSALDLAAMAAQSGTRTIFDKAPIVLVKHAADHYRVEVWQSFATHVWDLLAAASREIALGI